MTGCRDVIFDTCRFIENQGVGCDGGGMHLVDGTVIVTNSLIADNSVTVVGDRRGGGIYVGSGGDLQVIHSTIRDNNAYGGGRWGAAAAYGGGFFVEAGGTLNIRESILTGNSSTSSSDANTYGGAIDNRGVLQMVNSRVVSNWAERGSVQVSTDEHGDGLYSVGDAAIVNCTIADNNVATRNQFGIHYSGGTLAITNSIIWGHATADLTNLPVNVEGTFDGFFHNLYGTAMTGGVEIDMDGIAGCIIGDPLFEGDGEHSYRLRRAISPAIDAGINLPWMHGASDVAGYARIMYGGRSFTVDMGAYETFPVPGSMIRFR